MIDTGEGPTWTEALAPDRRSLAMLTDAELQSPFIIENICIWFSCSLGDARDLKGKELLRRTMTTERPK
jgi:hypothetical protein